MKKKRIICLAVLLLSVVVCYSQESQGAGENKAETYAPYLDEEFPQWLKDVRRAEIILIGSIPFTMFLAIEAYDFYRFFSSDMNPVNYPWPLRSPLEADYTIEEKAIIVVTALSISLCIAVIDYLIVCSQRESKRKKAHPK
ncbi:MAG: hypothetical protein JW881_07855 [Spirochaetales bacterium]|nr:hypothetical protein [Spirochaetales bacterium]